MKIASTLTSFSISPLETESKRRTRNNNIKKIILGTIAVAGLLSVALVAPNVLQAFAKLGLIPKKRQKEIISVARKKMVKAGLLAYQGKFVRLTEKGKSILRKLEINNYKIKKPKRWDKKWRILIFDIPQYRNSLRFKIRRTIRAVGFVQLQKSVWVYPYPCEDLVSLLKAEFKIGKDLLYLIVDMIENDIALKKYFGLV